MSDYDEFMLAEKLKLAEEFPIAQKLASMFKMLISRDRGLTYRGQFYTEMRDYLQDNGYNYRIEIETRFGNERVVIKSNLDDSIRHETAWFDSSCCRKDFTKWEEWRDKELDNSQSKINKCKDSTNSRLFDFHIIMDTLYRSDNGKYKNSIQLIFSEFNDKMEKGYKDFIDRELMSLETKSLKYMGLI